MGSSYERDLGQTVACNSLDQSSYGKDSGQTVSCNNLGQSSYEKDLGQTVSCNPASPSSSVNWQRKNLGEPPPSAFFMFFEDVRPTLPRDMDWRQVFAVMQERWEMASPDVKAMYQNRHDEAKAQYEQDRVGASASTQPKRDAIGERDFHDI